MTSSQEKKSISYNNVYVAGKPEHCHPLAVSDQTHNEEQESQLLQQVTEQNCVNSNQNAMARLYGEPLFKLPNDLYIPPDALEIFLDAFEGPLDLLLYLIRKQNFNILDIPMVLLTKQYMVYVQEIRLRNLELAAEYLLMAAMLIEIKSRILLPHPPLKDEEETQDPRAQLAQRLIEYEKTKMAAQALQNLPQQGRDFFIVHAYHENVLTSAPPKVVPQDLLDALIGILKKQQLLTHHTITSEKLSVQSYMSQILRQLKGKPYIPFEHLFTSQISSAVITVTFIALLELAKEALIDIVQAEAFAPIYILPLVVSTK